MLLAAARWSFSHSRSSDSDTALPESLTSTGGASLQTYVEERNSSTACSLSRSASRSRIIHRLFCLPVSFCTHAHGIFCYIFHSGHSFKRQSPVCAGFWRHHHWAVAPAIPQCRYTPVRACPVFG